jgi:hypothetical protein
MVCKRTNAYKAKFMIFVKYRGRLGNNLFQWAFARVLSKITGAPMASPSLSLFPITETCSDRMPPERVEFVLPIDSYQADLDEWIGKARRGDVLVTGCPHNTKFFEPSKEWLVHELVPRDGEYTKAGERDIVLHFRLGDYFRPRAIGRFSYPTDVFERLLAAIDYEHCLVVTDSPENPVIRNIIDNHRGILVAKGVEHDYRTLYHAKRLVMSPSTFSWWAAWTGHAEEIFQPYEFSFWRKSLQFALELPGSHVKRFDSTGRILC